MSNLKHTPEGKIIIEQTNPVPQIDIIKDNDPGINIVPVIHLCQKWPIRTVDCIQIEKSKARKVALAICPELAALEQKNAELLEALKEAKTNMQWMWENLHLPHTPDHFNIPANAIESIDEAIKQSEQ